MMSDSNEYCTPERIESKQRRKRSLRNLQSPTSPLRLKIKLDSPFKSPSSSNLDSPSTSNSDLDTDSSDSCSAMSLEVAIPRYIYDMCMEDESADDRHNIESPYTSPYNQLRSRQTGSLTMRQRAIAGIADSELIELPYYDKPKELTEEMRLKKAEIAHQRRVHNQKQQEINKRETIKKLLTRQPHVKKKEDDKKLSRYNPDASYVTYLSNKDGITLTYPGTVNLDFSSHIAPPSAREPPSCAVQDCSTASRYRDPRTQLPYCSLRCCKILNRLT